MKLILLIVLLAATAFVAGAYSKVPKSNNKIAENYLQELKRYPESKKVENVGEIFLQLFGDFKKGATEEIIRKTYADEFYFNDTFRVLNNIDELVPYMIETAAMVEITTVELLDTSFNGKDYYLRWVMEMKFDVKNKDIYSKSIGMTQLRFNENSKIIFHQDYWDSVDGFYQHLPYLGYFVRKVRNQL